MESEAKVQTLAQHGQGITQAVYPQSGQGTQFKLRPPPQTMEVQNNSNNNHNHNHKYGVEINQAKPARTK